MNQESVQLTYEMITNPILRLLVYFLSGAVAGLCAAVIYLHRERTAAYRDLLTANIEQTKAFTIIGASLAAIDDKVERLNETVTNYVLKKPQ